MMGAIYPVWVIGSIFLFLAFLPGDILWSLRAVTVFNLWIAGVNTIGIAFDPAGTSRLSRWWMGWE